MNFIIHLFTIVGLVCGFSRLLTSITLDPSQTLKKMIQAPRSINSATILRGFWFRRSVRLLKPTPRAARMRGLFRVHHILHDHTKVDQTRYKYTKLPPNSCVSGFRTGQLGIQDGKIVRYATKMLFFLALLHMYLRKFHYVV